MRVYPVLLVAALAGCGSASPPTAATATSAETAALDCEHSSNPNPRILFDKDSHPYGLSVRQWSEQAWSFVLEQPAATNPFFDKTGADCANGQDPDGPVWFLASVPGNTLGSEVTRTCTIPRHRAIALSLAGAVDMLPCPAVPDFHPAPGQSDFDFLLGVIKPLIDGVSGFTAELDGEEIKDVLSYRETSRHTFSVKTDISMADVFDNCITGQTQHAVGDGLFLLFKPLKPGKHTIVVHGQNMHGDKVTLTENLTVQ